MQYNFVHIFYQFNQQLQPTVGSALCLIFPGDPHWLCRHGLMQNGEIGEKGE